MKLSRQPDKLRLSSLRDTTKRRKIARRFVAANSSGSDVRLIWRSRLSQHKRSAACHYLSLFYSVTNTKKAAVLHRVPPKNIKPFWFFLLDSKQFWNDIK